jgi:uncharacterized OsmC-like protein
MDTTRLGETIDLLKEQPDMGKFQFRGHTQWVYGHHAFSVIKDFHGVGKDDTSRRYEFIMHADEPDVLLGENHGPNPTETVMHALCCCVGSAIVMNAAARDIHLDKLEFDFEGDIDVRGFTGVSEDVRKGLQQIRLNVKISGDAPDSKLQELVKLGQEFSPVFDIVSNPVPITVHAEGQEVKAAM